MRAKSTRDSRVAATIGRVSTPATARDPDLGQRIDHEHSIESLEQLETLKPIESIPKNRGTSSPTRIPGYRCRSYMSPYPEWRAGIRSGFLPRKGLLRRHDQPQCWLRTQRERRMQSCSCQPRYEIIIIPSYLM